MCSDEVFQHERIIRRFVWDSLSAQTFTSLRHTDETCAILDEAISLINLDIDKALDIFNNYIKEKAECMKKQIAKKKKKKKNGRKLDEWFDWECKVGRRNVRTFLKKYHRSLPQCFLSRKKGLTLTMKMLFKTTKVLSIAQFPYIPTKE